MIKQQFNSFVKNKRVLVAPLDWGLGHTTRCMPIIKELQTLGVEVVVAASKTVQSILEKEFPTIIFIPLRGYGLKYSKRERWFPIKLFLQIPKIAFAILHEHRWLKKVVREHGISATISDNRFGLFHKTVPSVYITHQLTIKTGNRFTEKLLQQFHFRFIRKFTQCWVPDFEGGNNFAGELSHPSKSPLNVHYLGGLSRFEKHVVIERKYDLLILISGPEPQRTLFENLLFSQLDSFAGKVLFVRGVPDSTSILVSKNPNMQIVNHLVARELNRAIEAAGLVICRSGYTTVMDLIKLQKKAIMIPTPGQTEQEYLAGYLFEKGIFQKGEQKGFMLQDAIRKSESFRQSFPSCDMEQYKKVINTFIQSI